MKVCIRKRPLKSQTEPASQGRECQLSASAAAVSPPARPPASGSPAVSPLWWSGACCSLQQGAPASGHASLTNISKLQFYCQFVILLREYTPTYCSNTRTSFHQGNCYRRQPLFSVMSSMATIAVTNVLTAHG